MDEIIDEMRNTIATQNAEITRLKADLAEHEARANEIRELCAKFDVHHPGVLGVRLTTALADLARVRGQRDKALIALKPLNDANIESNYSDGDGPGEYDEWVEDITPDDVRGARDVLFKFRILDRDGTRTVEEIES